MKLHTSDKDEVRAIRESMIHIGYLCGQSAHFGGGLSIVELLFIIYKYFLRITPESTSDPSRDVFVLSKGHGVLGLYGVLHHFGFIKKIDFEGFQSNGGPLIAHPIKNEAFGIESSNGSLGQGLSFLSGVALASRLKNEDRRFYTLLGDGECNEGSVWEAAMFCSQQSLSNIVAIVDVNGFQNDDSTEKVSSQKSISDRWASFGWKVYNVDGHDLDALHGAVKSSSDWQGGPSVILAKTVKGKGVSFMEGNNEWHHNRLTSKTYEQALKDVRDANR